MHHPPLTLPELAASTGRSVAWWKRNWQRMHLSHGFPRKLPGLWAWPRQAVAAWCALPNLPCLRAPAATALPVAASANDNHLPALSTALSTAMALLDSRFGLSQEP